MVLTVVGRKFQYFEVGLIDYDMMGLGRFEKVRGGLLGEEGIVVSEEKVSSSWDSKVFEEIKEKRLVEVNNVMGCWSFVVHGLKF